MCIALRRSAAALAAASTFLLARSARAQNALTVSDPTLDPPTLVSLGVQMLIQGDANFNAGVTVQYKKSSESTWSTGMPLFRVHPEHVASGAPPAQFAGSIFYLQPSTSYDIQLHAVDPDGGDFTKKVTGSTIGVPGDPPSPHVVNVTDQTSLQAAVTAAKPGDVIVLANGTYGPYLNVSAAGAPGNPIVIRGQTQSGVVLDGGGCASCNVIEYYNTGYVHLENLTIQNAQRAVRVQTTGTNGDVFRRLHVTNVILGITTNDDANGYYVADNVLEGRLTWPQVYKDDMGAHANDDGINIHGSANVIAYNRISGFGDAMKTEINHTRANDFYGNDVLWTYDNGVELDACDGNCRFFFNRLTNNSSPTSYQPIFGGPAYCVRNVIVNVADEPFKLHAEGGESSPSGSANPAQHGGQGRLEPAAVHAGRGLRRDLREQPVRRRPERRLLGAMGHADDRTVGDAGLRRVLPRWDVRAGLLEHGSLHDVLELRRGRRQRHLREAWAARGRVELREWAGDAGQLPAADDAAGRDAVGDVGCDRRRGDVREPG